MNIYLISLISEDYESAEKVDFNKESVWFACAESLALFHATFMNSDLIGKDTLQLENKETIEKRTLEDKDKFEKFMNTYENVLDTETKKYSSEFFRYIWHCYKKIRTEETRLLLTETLTSIILCIR